MRVETFNIQARPGDGSALKSLLEEVRYTKHHYLKVFTDEAYLSEIRDVAEMVRREYDGMFVVGIGGSTQGSKAAYTFSDVKDRRLVFLDDVDPDMDLPMDRETLQSFCVLVVSKSGTTLETITQVANISLAYKTLGLNWKERVFFILGDGNGPLNRLCERLNGIRVGIPESIPGRFSVFSSVGLLPLMFSGVDVESFLDGARKSLYELEKGEVESTHLMLSSVLSDLIGGQRNIMVNAVYSVKLVELSHWLSQLVSESLGKDGKGITPVVFKGPPLQHSQLQLYREGPDDKLYVFYRKESHRNTNALEGFEIVDGKTLGDVLVSEEEGTRKSLEVLGRPIIFFGFEALQDVGYFMHLWMASVALAGKMVGVNPYTQDGVDEGKRLSLRILKEGVNARG